MRSSKKFMTKVLTAALALSMVAGTGVCAAAVEDTEYGDEPVVIAPADENNDLSDRLTALKEMLSEAAQTAYAKLSQTTLSQLMQIMQKVKAAEKIVADADDQVSKLELEASIQIVQIQEDAEALIASANGDEEFEAQIMETVEQKINQIVYDTKAQIDQIMADSTVAYTALMDEADAQIAALKEKLQARKDKVAQALQEKVDAIQQQIAAVKEQVEATVQQAKEAVEQTIVVKRVQGAIKFAMAQAVLEKADEEVADLQAEVDEKVAQIMAEAEELVAAADDEEFTAQIMEQVDQKINQLLADTEAQVEQILADAQAESDELLAESEALFAESQEIYEARKAALDAKVEEIKEKVAQTAIAKLTSAQFKTKMAEKIMAEAEAMEAKMKYELAQQIYRIRMEEEGLIDAIGDDEELVAEIREQIDQKVQQLYDDVMAQIDQMWEEAQEKAAALLADADTLTEEGKAQIEEEVAAFKDKVAQDVANFKEAVQKFIEDIKHCINGDDEPEEEEFSVSVDIVYDDENAYETGVMELGTSAHFMIDAENGSGNYVYAVYYKNVDDETWTARQGFKTLSDNNNVSFTPKTAGVYDICVKVKDTDTNEIKKIYFTVEAAEPVPETGISADQIVLGETVTLIGVPEEGMENCTYAFYYKKADADKWSCRQKFSEDDTATITPVEAGEYQICIKIKDGNNQISKKYFDLTVNEVFE